MLILKKKWGMRENRKNKSLSPNRQTKALLTVFEEKMHILVFLASKALLLTFF